MSAIACDTAGNPTGNGRGRVSLSAGRAVSASSTIPAVIRLRQSLDGALGHPLLGPLLLLLLALVLAFVCLHTIEHGAEGLLLSCVLLAATGLGLAVFAGRTRRAHVEGPPLRGRAPPTESRRLLLPRRVPRAVAALPLRL